MTPDMKKVPSYLKGLAETRARAAGDVARLEALQAAIAAEISRATTELDACDLLIRKFDVRLDPTQVPPIRSQDRYGKRGALRTAIIGYLQQRASAEVPTTELVLAMEAKFKLHFRCPLECVRWQKNTLLRELKRLAEDGIIERLHDPKAPDGTVGR